MTMNEGTTDTILHPARRLRTTSEQGNIPVPDGMVLYEVKMVEWTLGNGKRFGSDDVVYTHDDPTKLEPDEGQTCAIVVNTSTGAYDLREPYGNGPWDIRYVLGESTYEETKRNDHVGPGDHATFVLVGGIGLEDSLYVPQEGDVLKTEPLPVAPEGADSIRINKKKVVGFADTAEGPMSVYRYSGVLMNRSDI